jgi:hypothetical protein
MKRMVAMLMVLASTGVMAQTSPTCSAAANETKMSWPNATNPVWELCWLPPNRSSGPRGSGLELRNVYYMGKLILKRAHSPMLFADYRNGGGGNCYRDWKDSNSAFAAEAAVRNQLGTPTITAKTNCDLSPHPTNAYGACPFTGNPVMTIPGAMCFTAGGVAIENLERDTGVVLTTQYTAGWYKYSARFYLYANGDFDSEMGFGNSDGTYNNTTHWHHNYWRLDFDLDGANNDQFILNGTAQATEWAGLRRNGNTPNTFRVFDSTAGFGYDIDYAALEGVGPNESGRNFHLTDVIATQYKPAELADNPNWSLGDCTMAHGALANNEALAGQDIVLYYRGGARDATANNWPDTTNPIPQDSMVCKVVRPRFKFVGTIGNNDVLLQNGFE